MTEKPMKFLLIGCILVALAAGCAGGGGNRLNIKDAEYNMAVSMDLPPGWALEGRPEKGFSLFSEKANPENRGGTVIYPAEGKSLAEWIEINYIGEAEKVARSSEALAPLAEHFMGREAGEAARASLAWELLSRDPIEVGGLEAEQIVDDSYGKRQIRTFVKKDDAILEIGFISLPEEWEKNEPLFRDSLATLKVR